MNYQLIRCDVTMNENLEKAKSILELDEFNKLKNQIDSNNYTIEEINNLINEYINYL